LRIPKSLYRDAASIGCNLAECEQQGLLHIVFTSPQVLLRSVEVADSPLNQTLLHNNIRRVVGDSITHFTRISADTFELRHIYNRLRNAFRREGVTAMFLGEECAPISPLTEGTAVFRRGLHRHAALFEIDSAIQRAILVLKMRSSDHDKSIHSYTISANDITVGEALEGRADCSMVYRGAA
jgi:circadian clock protein KaiC